MERSWQRRKPISFSGAASVCVVRKKSIGSKMFMAGRSFRNFWARMVMMSSFSRREAGFELILKKQEANSKIVRRSGLLNCADRKEE